MNGPGVVDPLRVPDWIREPVERAWREAPPVARLFLGLAVIDFLGRSVGLLAPGIHWGDLTPLSFVSAFVPHLLWITLPAILLLRRPDARTATPWLLWGAIVLATDQFASAPIRAFVLGDGTDLGRWGLTTFVSLVDAGVVVTGWVLLARGLVELSPREPPPSIAGLSNLALGLYALVAVIDLGNLLTGSTSIGDPGLDQLNALNGLVGILPTLAWAYLVWILIRGLEDPRRPVAATMTAAAGATLAAVAAALASIFAELWLLVGQSFPASLQQVQSAFGWIAYALGPTLVAAAFALGLAEPPVPFVRPPAPVPVPGPVPPRPMAVAPPSWLTTPLPVPTAEAGGPGGDATEPEAQPGEPAEPAEPREPGPDEPGESPAGGPAILAG